MNDPRDYDEHGHPVIVGAACGIGVVALRRYAVAYVTRTQGPAAADLFIRRIDRRVASGLVLGPVLVIAAILVSFASVAAFFVMLSLTAVLVAGIILPPVARLGVCMNAEITHRRETRGPLIERLYQTGRDLLPRLFV